MAVQTPAAPSESSNAQETVQNGTDTPTQKEANGTTNNISSEPPAPKGSLCEIKSLVQKSDNEVVEKEDYLTNLGNKPYLSYALVSKQIFNHEKKLEKTLVEINSPHILAALKSTVTYYPAEPLHFEGQVSFDSPFKLLNHYSSDIEAWGGASDSEEAKDHIRLLLEFLRNEAGDKRPEAERLVKANLITFELLWVIFKPGDLIYTQEYGHERLYRLQKTGYADSCTARGRFFEVSCEYTNCDGSRAGYSTVNLRIWEKQEFVGLGPSSIDGLSLYPLKFREIQDDLFERLVERGKRYLEIRGVRTFDYDGLFMYLKTPPYGHYDENSNYDGIWLPRSGAGRVVVDCKTFVEEMRRQKEEMTRIASLLGKNNNDSSGRADAARQKGEVEPLLCPPHVYGYNLDIKEWCKFFVNSLKDFTWQENAMDALILPETQKRLIGSLVTAHRYPDQARDESLLKGKGLIILLHGTPGTGKTYTAEMVAEHTKRPLLKISTGELGSWGERISHNLKQLLEYASIWHAVVLIDEADVFLEERKSGTGDNKQNNMVAVFLKQLEYYQGILFLTSNRVQTFDSAIRSRLHLALQYKAPDQGRRGLLWAQQISMVPSQDRDIDMERALSLLEGPEMNGREISNAVTTARTLAASENSKLTIEHLRTVLSVWESFQVALSEISN